MLCTIGSWHFILTEFGVYPKNGKLNEELSQTIGIGALMAGLRSNSFRIFFGPNMEQLEKTTVLSLVPLESDYLNCQFKALYRETLPLWPNSTWISIWQTWLFHIRPHHHPLKLLHQRASCPENFWCQSQILATCHLHFPAIDLSAYVYANSSAPSAVADVSK